MRFLSTNHFSLVCSCKSTTFIWIDEIYFRFPPENKKIAASPEAAIRCNNINMSIGDGRGKHNAVNFHEVAINMENDTPGTVFDVQTFGLGMMAFDVG